MPRCAVEKAKGLHRRHPGLTFPVDMEALAAAEGCECLGWPFLEPVREVKQGCWIGLAEGLEVRERRHLIAHALGHHLLHSGNQLSFREWQKASRWRQEREAEEFAAHLLMPEKELGKVKRVEVWEIAEYFGVPENLAQQRLTRFATESELSRWQAETEEQWHHSL